MPLDPNMTRTAPILNNHLYSSVTLYLLCHRSGAYCSDTKKTVLKSKKILKNTSGLLKNIPKLKKILNI